MPISNFIAMTVTACISVWSPGPNNIMLLSTASRYGVKKNLPFMAGIWTGAMFVMSMCGLLGQTLSAAVPGLQPVMKYIATGYLLYLAWQTYKRTPPSSGADRELPTYVTGVLLQLVNVKMIIYGLSIFASYVIPYVQSRPLIVIYAFYLMCIGAIGNLIWAFAGNVLKKVYEEHYKIMNLVMALLLVWCALRILGVC
ncbi:MAG: LysE family transporter [Lachnospiraceae bacterium]|nr:LysE family transporter [Lachnospiraceae bacterium]